MATENLRSGERRNVTVLFSDMKGFTKLSEKMDPEEVDSLMNQIFSTFESIICKYDGIVEKYIGDALVAVFGARHLHEDDAARAVNAALNFLDEIKALGRTFAGREVELKFRTGVHTGLIATGKRGDFDVVTGHAMSVASRLQEAALANTVLVSAATREKCESDFLFGDELELKVKGKREPLKAFLVSGRNTDPLRYTTPYSGRDQQLKAALKAYLKADLSTACGFFVLGDPGIGKTRFVAEFVSKLKGFPDFDSPVLYARARRYRALRFSIANDLLFNYLHIDQYCTTKAIESALLSKTEVSADVARRFAVLISEEANEAAESSSFMLHYAILEQILRTNADSPYSVILFIDNVQDLDSESREFLSFFSRNTKLHPFMILSGRKVAPELAALFPEFETVQLKPLREEESHDLVSALWKEGEESAKKTIVSTSEGNPLFIEEYVKFATTNRDISTMPMTIQNILLSGFDRYDAARRETLRKLSVFLHSFTLMDAEYIQAKTGESSESIPETLSYFLGEGVLVQENNLYFFKHELAKQALYNSLLNYNKKILHRLVAELLFKQKSPNMVRLVHHLARAEDWQTLEATIFEDPSHLQRMEYLRFIDLLREHHDSHDSGRQFQYLFAKAAILFNNGKTEGAETILREIVHATVSQRRHEFSAHAYHLLCAHYAKAYCFQKSLFCGQRALHHYQADDPSSPSIQSVYNSMALAALLAGNYSENQTLIELMSPTASNGAWDFRIETIVQRALFLDDYRSALEVIRGAIPAEKSVGDEGWIIGTVYLVRLFRRMYDFEALEPAIHDLLEVFSQDYATLTDLYAILAECRFALDDRTSVGAYLKQAEYYATQSQSEYDQIRSLESLSTALHSVGETEDAGRFARAGLEMALRHSTYTSAFTLLILLVEIHELHGARSEAAYVLEESDFYVRLGTHLDRRDLILYHYFVARLRGGSEGERSLLTARTLLDAEIREIGKPHLVERFLASRVFGQVRQPEGPAALDNPGSGPYPSWEVREGR